MKAVRQKHLYTADDEVCFWFISDPRRIVTVKKKNRAASASTRVEFSEKVHPISWNLKEFSLNFQNAFYVDLLLR